jgi:hypothetical protein
MTQGKVVSGFVALGIYLGLIFLVLYFYNIHNTKIQKFAEKPSDRVTVTLVNSDKTVFNKSAKKSNTIKPIIPIPIPIPLKQPKSVSKKHVPKKVVPPKRKVPKKVVRPKRKVPKKVVPPKRKVPKKVVPPKKSAKDLFSSVKTKDVAKRPVKQEHRAVKKPPRVIPKEPSRVKHNSSISDRIKNTHQTGRVSNSNRDRGVKSAYVSKVKRHMNNWNAGSVHKGKRVSLSLTIYSSGKFKYRILSGGDMDMKNSLSQFLDRLNRMGQLGRHSKSSPYTIKVNFIVR